MAEHYDCIIIGGGPAGYAAGLYASRAGLNTLLFEEMFPGGQIATTHMLENYPGFPEGIPGPDFGGLVASQAQRFGLQTQFDTVESLALSEQPKRVQATTGQYTADTVILCMGAQPRRLGVDGEAEFRGSGVSYCATCDGAFFRDKTVAVVGGGDTACEDALYLARLAKKVYIIHRRDTLRAASTLQKRVLAEEKIELLWDSEVQDIQGAGQVQALSVHNNKAGEQRRVDVDAVFVAVGVTPRSELVTGQVALDDAGHIATDERMRTDIDGVFAAGDVRNGYLRQVVTACADGAIAATAASEYLLYRK